MVVMRTQYPGQMKEMGMPPMIGGQEYAYPSKEAYTQSLQPTPAPAPTFPKMIGRGWGPVSATPPVDLSKMLGRGIRPLTPAPQAQPLTGAMDPSRWQQFLQRAMAQAMHPYPGLAFQSPTQQAVSPFGFMGGFGQTQFPSY